MSGSPKDHATLAVYPEPLTPSPWGEDPRRTARLFDGVIVAGPLRTTKNAVQPGRAHGHGARCCDCPQVQVEPFEGLVTAFAAARGACAMVRSLRSAPISTTNFNLQA